VNRRLIFSLLLLAVGCGALFALQRHGADTPITLRPLLELFADTQRQAERLPLRLTQLSEKEESEIGERIARDHGLTARSYRNSDAQEIAARVASVGSAVAAHAQRKGIVYHFYLEDSPGFVNAFALPGGQIVMGRGLLELIESEDELAAILGHEIAHVDKRHAIERLQYEMAARKIGLEGFYRLGQPLVQIFRAGYTKELELEADRVGLDLAVAAGYSPTGGVEVMKRFEKFEPEVTRRAGSPVKEIANVSISALQEYFRSHPPAAERRAALEAEIRARGWNPSQALRTLSIRSIFLTDAAERLDRKGEFAGSLERLKEALKIAPDYGRAWDGFVQVTWRSGDASETVAAAQEAMGHGMTVGRWVLLARGLAASDPGNALARFRSIEEPLHTSASEAGLTAQMELAGLQLAADQRGALDEYQRLIGSTSRPPERQAALRREMAWWMYRAGKLDLAEKELEAARQVFPQARETYIGLAWIQSDRGRQADAQALRSQGRPQNAQAGMEALAAVIDWRTGQQDRAKADFQRAAAADPVWMVPRWVENNYSASAATVIKQLQAAESARRLKEEQERQSRTAQ